MLTPDAGWDNEWQEIPGPEAILVAVVQNPELLPLQGKRLSEIAALWHEDPIDALCDLLIKDKAFTSVAVFGMDEADVALALQQPWVSIDNDSQGTSPDGLLGKEHPHPRAYGTFPAHPAQVRARGARAHARGRHPQVQRAAGAEAAADRPRRAQAGHVGGYRDLRSGHGHDLATFEQPNQLSQGMDYVLVNGVPVIAEGRMTQALPGKVLRGPGYQRK